MNNLDRLRYRIWDKNNEHFITEGVEFTLSADGFLWFYHRGTEKHKMLYIPENYEINQCTGLKDKNEILIYEGDYLRRFKKTGEAYKKIKLVSEGRYGFLNLEFAEESEIVANYFENPELLKQND